MKKIRMLEALEAYERVSEHLNLELLALALGVSLLAAFGAMLMYRFFYESRGTGSRISRAFPLLSLSITTLFICIQLSIPLSLGLLGSLSIIRFRTPIKEPEEVGFIMLVIASSIASATYNFSFILVMYAFALISMVVVRKAGGLPLVKRDGLLALTIGNNLMENGDSLKAVLDRHLSSHRIQNTSSRDGRTSLQITFAGLRTDSLRLQADLRDSLAPESVNLFLDRPGGIR